MTRLVLPIGPVTLRDVDGLPTPFDACASCGYLGVRPPGIGDGALPENALMTERICTRCAHRGPPVEFDAAIDYVRFIEALHAAPSQRA